jgi:hypothetical protein
MTKFELEVLIKVLAAAISKTPLTLTMHQKAACGRLIDRFDRGFRK